MAFHCGRELLQGLEPPVDSNIVCLPLSCMVVEALLPSLPALGQPCLHVVKPLEHNVEHVADVGVHDSLGALEPGVVGVGRTGRLQHALTGQRTVNLILDVSIMELLRWEEGDRSKEKNREEG